MYKIVLVFVLTTASFDFVYGLQDPTQPSNFRAADSTTSVLTLESILISGDRRVAVINGKAITEGESAGGVKVVSIDKDSVRVLHSGNVLKLMLNSVSIRQEK
ncbi:MAG: MSHA biogenesis protein MshK [Oceanicoccus sp.]